MAVTESPQTEATPVSPAAAEPRVRLHYLDGIRAICALFVMLAHQGDGSFFRKAPQQRPYWFSLFDHFWAYDRYAVSVFIILSGYCLMLPVARTVDGTLQGGVKGYLRRRARRMLPPYYAALALSIVAIGVLKFIPPPPGVPDRIPIVLTWGGFLSHLLMVHNLRTAWVFQIDGPMWSVATEWDIYFLFPALLLLWRRWGIGWAITAAFVVGMLPHYLLHKWLDSAAPWYAGLFALGMVGALIGFSHESRYQELRTRLPWGVISAGLWVCIVTAFILKPIQLKSYPLYLSETAVGMATVCLLISCTRVLTEGRPKVGAPLLRLFESHVLVLLGTFSYSIYLVHMPVQIVAVRVLERLPFTPLGRFTALYLVEVPLNLLLCYGFHLLFERPFMSTFARRTTKS